MIFSNTRQKIPKLPKKKKKKLGGGGGGVSIFISYNTNTEHIDIYLQFDSN